MYFEKQQMRQKCIDEGMFQHMPFIKRYLVMTWEEKLELYKFVILHNALRKPIFEDVEKWYQRWWRKFKDMLPWNVAKQKWYDAFLYFYENEQEEHKRFMKLLGR
jgi:hypothetical protein